MRYVLAFGLVIAFLWTFQSRRQAQSRLSRLVSSAQKDFLVAPGWSWGQRQLIKDLFRVPGTKTEDWTEIVVRDEPCLLDWKMVHLCGRSPSGARPVIRAVAPYDRNRQLPFSMGDQFGALRSRPKPAPSNHLGSRTTVFRPMALTP